MSWALRLPEWGWGAALNEHLLCTGRGPGLGLVHSTPSISCGLCQVWCWARGQGEGRQHLAGCDNHHDRAKAGPERGTLELHHSGKRGGYAGGCWLPTVPSFFLSKEPHFILGGTSPS